MLAIMLVAVMLDRPAITLRNVALAALAILVFSRRACSRRASRCRSPRPSALVAGYEAIAARRPAASARPIARDARRPRPAPAGRDGLFLTSLIAGLATAPFGAYHFQRVAPLTLVANLAAMPVVGIRR